MAEQRLGLGQMPEQVRIALERSRSLERLERVRVVAPRLIGVADRVVRVEAGWILGEGAQAHREPLVVVSRLLQKESEHRLVLRLVRARLETPARDVDAAAIVALRDAVQADDAHGDPIGRVVGRDLAQTVVGGDVVTTLQGIHRLDMQALAVVVRVVGRRRGLTGCGDGQVSATHAPGDVGLRAVSQREPRVAQHGGIQRFHGSTAPAKEQIEAPLVRGQRVRRLRGYVESLDVGGRHALLRVSPSRSATMDPSPTLPWSRRRA